ncbi:MAG: N-6 DNA methylase [Deltaproteobacteria bacterium]|nr:N-6 DNA methylase [Deltaproteobacteria bacterium]
MAPQLRRCSLTKITSCSRRHEGVNAYPSRKGKVMFIDGSREFHQGTTQNYLRDEDVKKIAKTFHAGRSVERYARMVPVIEIEKNDWNLNISRYVETAEAEEEIDVAGAVKMLRVLEKERGEAERVMNKYLKDLGYAG